VTTWTPTPPPPRQRELLAQTVAVIGGLEHAVEHIGQPTFDIDGGQQLLSA
jgi:hypothetical protein